MQTVSALLSWEWCGRLVCKKWFIIVGKSWSRAQKLYNQSSLCFLGLLWFLQLKFTQENCLDGIFSLGPSLPKVSGIHSIAKWWNKEHDTDMPPRDCTHVINSKLGFTRLFHEVANTNIKKPSGHIDTHFLRYYNLIEMIQGSVCYAVKCFPKNIFSICGYLFACRV